jgi:hypothetical protein
MAKIGSLIPQYSQDQLQLQTVGEELQQTRSLLLVLTDLTHIILWAKKFQDCN